MVPLLQAPAIISITTTTLVLMSVSNSEEANLLWASPPLSHSNSFSHAESGDQDCPGEEQKPPNLPIDKNIQLFRPWESDGKCDMPD